jgi:hypothetical protein
MKINIQSLINTVPLTTDISKWGTIIKNENNVITLENPKLPGIIIVITVYQNKQTYEFIINDTTKFFFEDIFYGINKDSFIRMVGNEQTLHVQGGKVMFKSYSQKVNFIEPVIQPKENINKFITIDLETRNINGVLRPYCISLYDGNKMWSFYLSDYDSIDKMIIVALTSLMKIKYNGWNVYLHNGSLFDCIFLLRYMTEIGHVDLLKKDNKFINIKLSWGENKDKKGNVKFNINFRDSFLLLPSSLRKLSIAFGVESKGFFPMKFVNDPSIPLTYVGPTPNFYLYEDIDINKYNNLISNN